MKYSTIDALSLSVWLYSLGIKVVQKTRWVAIAMAANHHQRHKRGQEYGRQHPDGHNHHRLHADTRSPRGNRPLIL